MRIEGIEILNDADLKKGLRHKFYRVAKELNYSKVVREKFEEMAWQDVQLVKESWSPSAVVGARMYIIGLLNGEARSQNKLAHTAGTSPASISKLYQVMGKRSGKECMVPDQ